MANYTNKKPKKDNSVNFYINIDKLKNLKISAHEAPSKLNYSSIKSQSIQANNRKSLMLRQYGSKDKKAAIHSSYDQAVKSLSRIYGNQSQEKSTASKA